MLDNEFDRISEVDMQKTMESYYIDYAMSVIAQRALPDVRDGLKPVQRRVLYSMIELNNGPDKPHRKCARIVGDTMGKYHPHGDTSIYGSLVTMAQDWNMRYPLVDGHGNFGSVDGDSAAAMRYTEARLSKISMEMLADINKNTVDFVDNFDGTEKEPTVLPARFPNLLVNGTTGIAVGMATNIPPHNLREVISAVVRLIDNKISDDITTVDDLMECIKGPDFPTGGQILGTKGIEEAYRTGRGKIRCRALTDIETLPNGKNQIIVTELPYMVNKANLIKNIADLVKDKKIDGITAIRDETNREGMRVVIELRKDANANVILNLLYKHTQMQDTFGVNMLALIDNQPKVMNLLEVLEHYLDHQVDVVTRRIKYDLDKAEARAHILEALLKALDVIDEVIARIRASKTVAEAKESLVEFLDIDDGQAQAIVDMRLRALAALERQKIEDEYAELQKQIEEFRSILADPKKLLGVIKEEITVISDKFGNDRMTSIGIDYSDISMEDLVPQENTVIAMTSLGYIKRMSVDNFGAQHRGGKGIKGITTIQDDYIEDLLICTTHSYVMFFTNSGRAYSLKAYEIPESSRNARGVAIVNLLQLQPEEKITATIPINEIDDNKYLFMVTKTGIIKKTRLYEYRNIRKTGLNAINLKEGDELIEVKQTTDEEEEFLITKYGMCIHFKDTDVRPTGRVSMGVIGMNLDDGDEIVGMQLKSQGGSLLIVTEKGMGKRTDISEFTLQRRGGKGLKCYKITERTGYVVGVKSVNEDHEVMLITDKGIIIQIRANDISTIGRITMGVKIMNLDENSTIVKIAKVRDKIEGEEETTEETDQIEEQEPVGSEGDGEDA
ncbi:MAG: DNA gyrase subunit A [Lachnospiraceae bacterium]|nr:DNA gyrase subunit A [Lachnospiraceae bacterium]